MISQSKSFEAYDGSYDANTAQHNVVLLVR